MLRSLELHFPYEAQVRRTRQRKLRTTILRAIERIHIQSIRRAETAVAYRIEFPRGCRLRPFEVLRYGNRLWWPWIDSIESRECPTYDVLWRNLDQLFCTRPLSLGLKTVDQDLSIREVDSSTRELLLAEYQGKASNILIVNDRVFVAGGSPFFIPQGNYTTVASTRATRSAHPNRDELNYYPGTAVDSVADHALCFGQFRFPNAVPLACEAAGPRRPLPRIRVLLPEQLNFVDLRVDAAFRLTNTEIGKWRKNTGINFSPDLFTLYEQAEAPHISQLTDRRLCALLGFFQEGCDVRMWWWSDDEIRSLASFVRSETASRNIDAGLEGRSLTPSEDAAIAALADAGP